MSHCHRSGLDKRYSMLRTPKNKSRKRPGANKLGYTYRWQQSSKRYLRQNPICAINGHGCTTEATCVDHIKPHKNPAPGWYARFWDVENWQPCCKACHDAKTYREHLMTHPIDHLQTSRPKGVVICGPPGSGKSTHARSICGPNDIVFDWDDIAAALNPSFGRGSERDSEIIYLLIDWRDALILRVISNKIKTHKVILIVSDPHQAAKISAAIGFDYVRMKERDGSVTAT